MKKILFIGHEAERTGAPIILLHLLRWLAKNRSDLEIDLLLLRDGDLRTSYEKVAQVYVLPSRRLPKIVLRGLRYIRRRLGIRQRPKTADLAPFSTQYDLVIGNTVGSLDHLELFKRRGNRTICWLHEMRSVIDSFYPERARFLRVSTSVDRFVVPSRAVETVLREYGVTAPADVIHAFSALKPLDADAAVCVRASLGIPGRAFVVGGSGTVSVRKGTDLFLRIAAKLSPVIGDIYFVWVGGPAEPPDVEVGRVMSETGSAIKGRVIMTGMQPDPGNFFANMDVFALTSREDPFPLVCLEAAGLGKPVVCFENAGGMPEFVGDDAGSIVPFGDIDAFAERIAMYYRDRRALVAAGSAARRKVETKFSLNTSCEKMAQLIDKISA